MLSWLAFWLALRLFRLTPAPNPSIPNICSASPSEATSARSVKGRSRDRSPADSRNERNLRCRHQHAVGGVSCRSQICEPNLPASVNAYDITGVSGLLDQHYTAFGGLSADIRYRLLDRATAPFGLAIGAEPHWGRADEVTGERANQYGVDFVAAADWEIVPDRVVAAFNLLYQPETTRLKLTGTWSQESTAGVAIGVMAQVRPGIFVGGEARYLRHVRRDRVGYVSPGKAFSSARRSTSSSPSVPGSPPHGARRSRAMPPRSIGSLDLVNFERQQARVLFGVNF